MPNVSVQSRTIEPAQQKGRGASGVAFPRRAWERVMCRPFKAKNIIKS